MRCSAIGEDLYEYQFEPESGKPYGFNLYVLTAGRRALLIDTAYETQAADVWAALQSMGYSLGVVLVSHFHPDHVSGLAVLPKATVWGSEHYLLTLGEPRFESGELFPPVEALRDGSSRRFGSFRLSFRAAPGHTPCSLYTIIDRGTVHVADNLMAANDGTPILPWAPFDAVEAHIRSLEALKALTPEVLLLAHGRRIEGGAAINREIEDRLSYLRAVQDGHGECSVEEATADCSRRFLCEHWHIRRTS